MTLPLERPRNRKPITWLTVIGILLLPAVIGGILVAALSDPVERLDAMRTAIVNEDEPVEIDGQLVPLGRQLTAGLVEGSDEFDSNLDWTISNAEDAADGLAEGRYAAVVTIPTDFSAAATSTSPGATPTQATIQVETAPDAKIADGLITSEIANAAADLLGQQLTGVYLENVLLGYTTLGDQLGEAADGATQLADGARTAATGAGDLGEGAGRLADGAGALADGAGALAGGIGELAGGAGELAGGARELAGGIGGLADGLEQVSAGASQSGIDPAQLEQAVTALDGYGSGLAASTADAAQRLAAAAQTCVDEGGSAQLCGELAALAQSAADDAQRAGAVAAITGQLGTGLGTLTEQLPALTGMLSEATAGVRQLADGADQLAAGIDGLQSGAGELQGGASALQSGAGELQNGAAAIQTGAGDLSAGIGELADGTTTLADGLSQATAELPRYSDTEAADLASVVADPVAADGADAGLFGDGTIPLLSAVALWFGALATFIVQRALPSAALTSRRSSLSLALRAFAPAGIIGALQGLLVAGVAQLAAGYDVATWGTFAGLAALTGVAFAAVVQALVAVIGGFGRGAAAVVGVIALATGVVSTVPAILATLAGALPTAPAVAALTGAVTGAGGIGAAVAGLVAWAAVAFLVTLVAVTLRRSASPRTLLRPAV